MTSPWLSAHYAGRSQLRNVIADLDGLASAFERTGNSGAALELRGLARAAEDAQDSFSKVIDLKLGADSHATMSGVANTLKALIGATKEPDHHGR